MQVPMLKQKPRRQINQQKKIDKKVALVRGIEINDQSGKTWNKP